MRHLYWALAEVTRFGRSDITDADRPVGWRAWIAGIALLNGIFCWLLAFGLYKLFRVHFVGEVIGAIVVCIWESWLYAKKFPGGTTVMARILQPRCDDEMADQSWRAAASFGVFMLKPLLLIVLGCMREMRWLVLYSVLSMCIMLDLSGAVSVRRKTRSVKAVSHWMVAAMTALLLSLLSGVHFTLVAMATLVIAFLLPEAAVNHFPHETNDKRSVAKAFYLCFGELAMLLAGVVGLAL